MKLSLPKSATLPILCLSLALALNACDDAPPILDQPTYPPASSASLSVTLPAFSEPRYWELLEQGPLANQDLAAFEKQLRGGLPQCLNTVHGPYGKSTKQNAARYIIMTAMFMKVSDKEASSGRLPLEEYRALTEHHALTDLDAILLRRRQQIVSLMEAAAPYWDNPLAESFVVESRAELEWAQNHSIHPTTWKQMEAGLEHIPSLSNYLVVTDTGRRLSLTQKGRFLLKMRSRLSSDQAAPLPTKAPLNAEGAEAPFTPLVTRLLLADTLVEVTRPLFSWPLVGPLRESLLRQSETLYTSTHSESSGLLKQWDLQEQLGERKERISELISLLKKGEIPKAEMLHAYWNTNHARSVYGCNSCHQGYNSARQGVSKYVP